MLSPLPLDPYEVLGVPKDATLTTIRSAHRKLALKFHPDRIKDDAERKRGTEEFQKAQQAYELLADDKRRSRYDDQVKLAALRKEAMMAERTMPIRSTTYTAPSKPPPSSRPPPTATYSYHDGRTYEERRPRYSDDDERYSSAPRSARKPSATYERRPATSQGEDRKKKEKFAAFGNWAETKLREKAKQAREKATHTETARQREKDRKRDADAKYARRATVESDDSSSDSDTATYVSRRPEPRRRGTYESTPKKQREPVRQPESKRSGRESTTSSSSSSEDEEETHSDKWAQTHRSATAYISERSIPGRPGVLRTDSAHYYSPRDVPAGRKSGSDRDEHREDRNRASKAPRPAETDSSRRKTQARKPPPVQTTTSSPAGLRGMMRDATSGLRSPTVEHAPEHKRPIPSMSRSNTMPIPSASRKDSGSGRGSKLKHAETQDSGYGSSGPNTPENHGTSPPKSSSKKYFIVEEHPDHARGPPRTVPIPEPEKEHARRARSPSPARERERDRHRDRERERDRDRERKRTERPTLQTDLPKPSRSASYQMSPEAMSARQNSYRSDGARSTMRGDVPPLSRDSSRTQYGEVPRDRDDVYRFSPENVRFSPKASDVRYARRGSDHRDKDYFSGSNHYDSLHLPRNTRREPVH